MGYPDGSFGPNKSVTRAELAVMFDRFARYVVGKELGEVPPVCTEQANVGLVIDLQDISGNPLSGASIFINFSETSTQFNDFQAGHYSGLVETAGSFYVRIVKEGFRDHVETIKIEREKNGCPFLITEYRTITLVPA